ncbi:MAG TPA: PAS domain-containing protein [Bryobacteraceae bacterium]|nr:PAS domain-containing protein [Bryobacteraceae bacterium]
MATRARVTGGVEASASAPEAQENDAQSLHRCLRDIVALSTLPAIWSNASSARIAESLAGSLFTMLVPEFVFVCLTGSTQTPPVSVAQTGRSETSPAVAEQVGPRIMEWARTRDPEELLPLNSPTADGNMLCVVTRAIGFNAELGVIGVAFAEGNPISPIHHVILNVAATQAGTATQRAHLLDSLRNSEERFRSLVSVITNVPWVSDPAGRFVSPQAAWEAYTAQSWQEHQGFGWMEALHPEDRARVKETWETACASRTLYQSEGRIWHAASGEWRHFMARATPLFNADRSVREWVGTYTDVENEKRSQRALRENEAHLRAMFDALPAAI